MKKLFLLLIISTNPKVGFAQSKVLETYVQTGLATNLSLKQEELELQKALKSIDIAKSNLFPKISFAPTYSLAAGGRRLEFPIGDLLNPVYSTLNKLTQSSSFPQVENVNQQLTPNNFHDTKVSFQYPVFNPDIKNNIIIQKELLTTENAKKKYLEFEIKHNIEIAYFQYLQALEAIKIYEQSHSVLDKFVVLNQKLVDNKVALKDVLLSSEYEVTKLDQQIIVAHKNKDLAKAYFNFLINRDFDLNIIADTSLIKTIPLLPTLAALQQNAIEQRPEFNQLQSGIRVNNAATILQEKNAKLPQLFVGGNTGFQGFGYKFKNQGYLVVQAGMVWELFHGYEKKHKIEQTKITKSVLELKIEEAKKQVSLQVMQSYKELEASFSNLNSTKGGIDKTQKILEILESRYKNGSAIFVELAKAQNDNMIAKLSESLAKHEIWVKYAMLKKVSGL
jgi:outer membrane protein